MFLTRIELHYATEQDYQLLHRAMEEAGFSRSIVLNGIAYHLPTAEYVIESPLSVTLIKNRAKLAANRTGKSSWVIVVQGSAWDWELPIAR